MSIMPLEASLWLGATLIVTGSLVVLLLLACERALLRLAPSEPAHARKLGAAVVACWALVAIFHGLALSNSWNRMTALASILGIIGLGFCIGGRRPVVSPEPSPAWRALGRIWASHSLIEKVVIVMAVALMAQTFLRAYLAPPLAWDTLSYHFVHVARWIRYEGYTTWDLPTNWPVYDFTQPNGDIFTAWFMLPFHGDRFVALRELWLCLMLALSVYGVLRELGSETRLASLGALLIIMLPPVYRHIGTYYVDLAVAAWASSMLFFGLRFLQRGRALDGILMVMALGLATGAKLSMLPIAVIVLTALGIRLLHKSGPLHGGKAFAGAVVIWGMAGGVSYLRHWWLTGSPVFPFGLELGSWTIFARHPAATDAVLLVNRAWLDLGWGEFALHYFGYDAHDLGFTPAGALLFLGGVAALCMARVRRDHGPKILWLSLPLLLIAMAVASGQANWIVSRPTGFNTQRYFILCIEGFLFWLALLPSARAKRWLVGTALGLALASDLPRAWSSPEIELGRVALAYLMMMVPLAGLMVATGQGARRWAAALLGAGLILWAGIALEARKAALRHDVYEAAREERAFFNHPNWGAPMKVNAIWRKLDADRSLKIAVTGGNIPSGNHWFLYPLYGSLLQNDLSYVPVTKDGRVHPYYPRFRARDQVDMASWTKRIIDGKFDYVVVLPPLSLEMRELLRRTDIYERVMLVGATGALFQVREPDISRSNAAR